MKTILHLILTSDIGRLLQQITNNHNTATTMQHLQPIPAYRTTLPADKVISISYSKK
jgi:hypothetical protein